MVDVDSFLGGVLNDEGWQERLGDSDAVAAVIQALEARLPAGGTLSEAEADRIREALHGDLPVDRLLAALR
jgi:hypothetical protein